MCLGIPMQVESGDELHAICVNGNERESVDMTLVGEQSPGTWVMVFLGAAREVVDEKTALQTRDALQAVSAIMSGNSGNIDHLFADLVNREPELPPHLQHLVSSNASTKESN